MVDECPVCYDAFKLPKLLLCGHTFCLGCIETYLKNFEDKSNIECPLCRNSWCVPQKGLIEFLTNYFVPVEMYPNKCGFCHVKNIVSACPQCNTALCRVCNRLHYHQPEEESDDESESLFQMRSLLEAISRSELLCENVNMFQADYHTQQVVELMFPSRSNGVFVMLRGNNSLLKYNIHGNIVDRIPLAHNSITSGIEITDGRLLVTYPSSERLVTCFSGSCSKRFAETPKFHPIGLTELRNTNIAVCGPTHLCGTSCINKHNNCDIFRQSHGLLSIFNPEGQLMREVVRDQGDYIFKFPFQMATNAKTDTIAICDRRRERLTILDYNGKIRGFFKGVKTVPAFLLPNSFPFMGSDESEFMPTSVCSTSEGNFVVSGNNEAFPYVVNPYGKLIGMLRPNCQTNFPENSICIDVNKNIWIGNIMGAIGVMKPTHYRNRCARLPQPISLCSVLSSSSDSMTITFGRGSVQSRRIWQD